MPPAGYPAFLQYLQSGRVSGVGSAKSADQTIHDPACGSGSLLLKAHDEAKGAPASTSRSTGRRWTTPPRRWPG